MGLDPACLIFRLRDIAETLVHTHFCFLEDPALDFTAFSLVSASDSDCSRFFFLRLAPWSTLLFLEACGVELWIFSLHFLLSGMCM